jgi:serine/threonine protein kinase
MPNMNKVIKMQHWIGLLKLKLWLFKYQHMNFKQKYPATDLLGKGGFAEVYKATDLLLDRIVALKFFNNKDREKYNLLKEIGRSIQLEHPNICRYFGAELLETTNIHGGVDSIEVGVMEYLDGGTIKQYLKSNPTPIKKLLQDTLNGIAYLHTKGIIHRDIKPGNILIKLTNEGPIAKITDFGISKILETDHTSSSKLMGSVAYMAPEQFEPNTFGVNGKIDTKVDIWGFGIMVYELLTGKALFDAETTSSTAQVMKSILSEHYEDKVAILPEPYKQVVTKCLQRKAIDRPDAKQVLALLHTQDTEDTEQTKQIKKEVVAEKKTVVIPVPKKEVVSNPKPKPIAKKVVAKKKNKEFFIILIALGVFGLGFLIYSLTKKNKDDYSSFNTETEAAYPPTVTREEAAPAPPADLGGDTIPVTAAKKVTTQVSSAFLQNKIEAFLKDEEERDFEMLHSKYLTNVVRFFDIQYPTKDQLYASYNDQWSKTTDNENTVKSYDIERYEDGIIVTVLLDYTFYGINTQEWKTIRDIKNIYRFNNEGDFLEVYAKTD